ncbi:MAG: DUF4197 domain-containing protein [Bacteroidota bacterium]
MKKIMTLFLCFALIQVTQAQFGKLKKAAKKAEDKISSVTDGSGLSQDEVGKALKEALNNGVSKASDALSAENGYLNSAYKIPIPAEAQSVFNRVKKVPGFQNAEDKMVKLLNQAAENAATKAKPIFVSAIKQMTIRDAMDILMGKDDAATRYLEKTTSKPLFKEFMPVIQNSLDEVNARTYWKSVVKAHNKLPRVKKADPELDRYVTNKALVGMFGLIEEKELDIRENQSARSTDLLKKVFAKQDK